MHIDDTETLTRARASDVHPPSQPGSRRRDGLEAGDITAGRRAARSRCHPGSGDVQEPLPLFGLRDSLARWPVVLWQRGLLSAFSRAPGAASCSAPLSAPPQSEPPSASLEKPASRPPSIGSVTSGMHCPLIVNPIIVIK